MWLDEEHSIHIDWIVHGSEENQLAQTQALP
jgi:hypothetical protein